MKIVDYLLVASLDIDLIEDTILQFIKEEWQPLAGIAFDGKRYMQAMVRYEEK